MSSEGGNGEGGASGGTKDHKMGVISCSSYVIGNIIGSGIFITANSVAEQTNSVGLTLLIWAVCAAISFLGAIVYVELATSIPDPGADYAYAMKVGWKAIAFGFMLVSVCITFPASAAVQSITFGQYMEKFLSVLIPSSSSPSSSDVAPSSDWIVISLALLLLVSLTILNFFSLDKFASTFQNVVSVCKLLSVAAIIGIGFYFLIFKGETQNFADMFAGSNWDIGTMTMAVYGGLWSYAGWDILNYGTPEIRNPRTTMPLSLFFGLGVVASAYTLINVSFFSVMTLEQVQNSTAIGDEFARLTIGNSFANVIPAMIAVLVMGTLNSNIFCGSRIMHAAAREGQLPSFLSGINPSSGSPRPAVLLQGIFSAVLCFVGTDTLVNSVTFVMWAQKVFTSAALLFIRYKHVPVESNAIRVPIFLVWALLIISLALVAIPFISDLTITLIGCGVIAIALAIYYVALKLGICGCGGLSEKICDVLDLIVKRALCVVLDVKTLSTPDERTELNVLTIPFSLKDDASLTSL
ncbi:hypothetical protein PENTCL1PPCAC_22414 [Pristionchus entomophagus]|uniref:Amino acid permease n=1 Tax=Pristionchus entomophagus TaxID=358040 RepID=A0AAV5U230_9BILA|nr:hypothetical protein PENTCL1PPCAC_22414 [Pristionchus entomophagus]